MIKPLRCNTNLFTTLERYETPEILVAANGTPIHVFGEGTFELEIENKIYTINAVFTPLIDANLLSLDQIDELGLTARTFPTEKMLYIGHENNIKKGIKFVKDGSLWFYKNGALDDNCDKSTYLNDASNRTNQISY